MKRIIWILTAVVFVFSSVRADEGMWILSLIGKNYQKMKQLGYKLTPEDIYSINHSSMKDAVGSMNHGMCTMELISPKGLMLTNHHCAYHALQELSTPENNYLKYGFWASTYEEELPVNGMTVWFVQKIEDVTDQILSEVNDQMSEAERQEVIRKVAEKIIDEAVKGTDLVGEVKEMFDGNQYFLFLYKVYKDVRLVGAPPEALGKFGGETDNWMWPRHTADFALFRVYTAPDGSPAEYSPDNVPLEAKYYFKISIKPKKEGDYAQIIGFPGTTNRYLTAAEVKDVMKVENDIRIEVRKLKLSIMEKYMKADSVIRLQYASKYAGSANYYKYSIGQNRDLKRLKVVKQKKHIEKQLKQWINQDPKRQEKYATVIKDIKVALKNSYNYRVYQNYWFEAIYLGSEIVRAGLAVLREMNSYQDQDSLIEALNKWANDFFEDYNAKVDKDLFINLNKLYKSKVAPDYYPEALTKGEKQYGSLEAYAAYLYSKSILTDKDRFLKWLANFDPELISKDPGIEYARSALSIYFALNNVIEPFSQDLSRARRLYMQAYMGMIKDNYPDSLLYPDANSTIRLTYGTIRGYKHPENPDFFTTRDSYDPQTQYFKPFTFIDYYLVKEQHYKGTPVEHEFQVPEKFKQLIEEKDFGPYADPNYGTIVTCFVTNNDITGGNSGSPVIDGEGNLIGVAFDGNWEAMSGDIEFDEQLQRTIAVDIRFVLFVIDKFAGAKRIMDELTIVE